MKSTNLGEFEELVLLMTCVLYREAYGVAVQAALEEQTGRGLSISAVHAALNRLEEKGYLRSWMGGATAERGGRRKRFFEITEAGRAALQARRQVREELWHLIPDSVLTGALSP